MENWKERFRNQFVDTYGEKDSKEWRIAYQPIGELEDFISEELDKAREEGKLEVLEELLEPMWDTPPEWKFMRLKTKMAHMMRDLLKLKDNK